eukprot:Platyproteum_vivax@DN14152_c0_g1_i1.p1
MNNTVQLYDKNPNDKYVKEARVTKRLDEQLRWFESNDAITTYKDMTNNRPVAYKSKFPEGYTGHIPAARKGTEHQLGGVIYGDPHHAFTNEMRDTLKIYSEPKRTDISKRQPPLPPKNPAVDALYKPEAPFATADPLQYPPSFRHMPRMWMDLEQKERRDSHGETGDANESMEAGRREWVAEAEAFNPHEERRQDETQRQSLQTSEPDMQEDGGHPPHMGTMNMLHQQLEKNEQERAEVGLRAGLLDNVDLHAAGLDSSTLSGVRPGHGDEHMKMGEEGLPTALGNTHPSTHSGHASDIAYRNLTTYTSKFTPNDKFPGLSIPKNPAGKKLYSK